MPTLSPLPSSSVADPGCLSRIPDFCPSRIPDLGSRIQDSGSRIQKQQQKGRVEKNFLSLTSLCSHKYHKIKNYFIFEQARKKLWANLQRIIELFTQKNVIKLSTIWAGGLGSETREPGSGKNLFRIPDRGVKKAPDPGSGSATLPSLGSFTQLENLGA